METRGLPNAYEAARQLVQAAPTRETLPVEGRKLFDAIQTKFDSALQAALDDGKESVVLTTPKDWTYVQSGPDADMVRPVPSEFPWSENRAVNEQTMLALKARYVGLKYEVSEPEFSRSHPNRPPVISMTVSVPKAFMDAVRAEIRREERMRFPSGDYE